MTDYHIPESCNKCSGENDVHPVDFINGHLCEAKTTCKVCGYTDYWAYGFFESISEIESKCKTYN